MIDGMGRGFIYFLNSNAYGGPNIDYNVLATGGFAQPISGGLQLDIISI
jgi:hypothetical protein